MKPLCKKTAYLFLLLLGFTAQANSQVVAVNDTIKTGPSQKVKFDVTQNDSFTCNTYTLSITGAPPSSAGTATFEGDFLVFTPAPGVTNQIVTVGYTLTCQDSQSSAATVYITVGAYNLPINVVQTNDNCIDPMPSGVAFGVQAKFTINAPAKSGANHNRHEGFHIPLVGDINGDGKPEIISLGVTGTGLDTDGRWINITDGQNGSNILVFDLRSLGGNATDGYAGTSQFQLRLDPYHSSPSNLAIADMDRDGIGEIVVAESGSKGRLYALKPVMNGSNQIIGLEKIWDAPDEYGFKHPLSGLTYKVFGQVTPIIVDINGDGTPEVIAYNKIYNGVTGKLLMAWNGAAATPTASSVAAGTGLLNSTQSGSALDAADKADKIKARAMVGRRPAHSNIHSDEYHAIPAIVDIDNDGAMEIITGTRIHKFNLTYLGNNGEPGDHTQNTYTTIEGPASVTLPKNATATQTNTYYLSDGFTRVADIDGDGKLDIIVLNNVSGGYNDLNVLITVWDYETQTVKAASSFYSDGAYGTFGIPFIGDINKKEDGWDGSAYTKRLPEICITTGRVYQNRSTASSGRSGIEPHSLANFSNHRFNNGTGKEGQIIAITYDASHANIEDRLRLSWAMEHKDDSDNTGITMFDFDNDGAFDLCYRDRTTIRVISPALGATDYLQNGYTGNAVLFSDGINSHTGYEAPAIADVNMDGSADIIVAGSTAGEYADFIRVFERKDGKPQWAPCPPVWNQALYNPLYINEDLTVPAKPISMLTSYIDGEGNTIQPYNGAWIQQPIVREGDAYVPIYRHPDAVLDNMAIERVDASNIRVRVTIRNEGLASINASTPIHLYQTENLGSSDKEHIHNSTVGIDIFPGEKVTLNYVMAGAMGMYVHCRIMDNGTSFPATGFTDCDLTNNYGFLPIIRANNDSYTVNRQSQTTLPVVANDNPIGNVSLEVVQQPQYGTVTVDGDKLKYTATHATAERDTLRYVLKCEDGSFTTTDTAYVYFVITNHVLPDNVITGTGSDCVVPFDEIVFDIQHKWHSPANTAHAQTGPLAGDLDGDGISEIITFSNINTNLVTSSTLNVLSGHDGSRKYYMSVPNVYGSGGWDPVMTAALVDSDGNGMGEIIFAGSDLALTSYEADTTGGAFSLVQKWATTYENPSTVDKLPQPFVVDFNSDGVPEVVVYNQIYNAQTGYPLGRTEADINTAYVGRITNRAGNAKSNFLTAADFDGDGKPELAAGGKIYKVNISPDGNTATCSILHQALPPLPSIGDGFTAVADLNLDGKLDVVVIDYDATLGIQDTRINIWSPTTGQVQQILIPDSDAYQGYPFIGDIDGEAIAGKRYPEICVVTRHTVAPIRGKVNAYKYDPVTQQFVLKWEFLNSDTSGGTGITLFDFNADGVSELVYRDQDSIRILNGKEDGIAPTLSSPNARFYCKSGTAFEYPIIVDTDGSGSAKICVTCSNNAAGIEHTLNVFESNTNTTTPWAPTRKVWNQVNYEPTLINNDLTVTRYPYPKHSPFEINGENYYPYNGALIQVPIMDLNLEPVVNSADPYAVRLHATQLNPTTVRVRVVVGNMGYANVSSSLPVTLYAGSIAVANAIETKPLNETLAPGATATVTFDIPSEDLPTVLVARVQDDGTAENPAASAYNDCNLDNNTASLRVLLAIDDYISPEKDKPITANVVANDVLGLCNANNIEVTIASNPTKGTVVMSGNSIIYTPTNGSIGTDTFTYEITCGSESSTATVTVVVNSSLMVEKIDGSDASEPSTSGIFLIKFTDTGFTFGKDLEVSYDVTAVNAEVGVNYEVPSGGTVILPANTPSVEVKIAPIDNFIVEGNDREVTLTITSVTSLP